MSDDERPWKYRICEHGRHKEDCIPCLREKVDFLQRWYDEAHKMHPAIAKHVDLQFRTAADKP